MALLASFSMWEFIEQANSMGHLLPQPLAIAPGSTFSLKAQMRSVNHECFPGDRFRRQRQAPPQAGKIPYIQGWVKFQIPEVYIYGSIEITQADDENNEEMPLLDFSKGKDSDDDDV
ncbi:hypothetical protein B0H14DRAFT_2626183 [Mycena olivaceomarginata]|nr:hypothetical protein B0H14DRAFT_2626183 [Mycena olivaceomarginata]